MLLYNIDQCFLNLFLDELNSKQGNFTVSHYKSPRLWNLVYADSLTCDPERPILPGDSMNFLQLNLKLLNPDSLGNPTEHFGDDETGIPYIRIYVKEWNYIMMINIPRHLFAL